MDKNYNTPYDDVYRTLMNDCRSLLIPLINEAFGEHYTGREEVCFHKNEHYINLPNGDLEKRTTDSVFTIMGSEPKKYLMECQSTPDNKITVRIFEYAMQVALDERELLGDTLTVNVPSCAVLFLRCNSNTPERMFMKLVATSGTLTVPVVVLKAQRYTLNELFEKKLIFLLPFYLFTYDRRLDEYNDDVEKLEKLKAEYETISDRLLDMVENEELDETDCRAIVRMLLIVAENLAKDRKNVVEGVRLIMCGRILNYREKDLINKGIEQWLKQGRTEGRDEGMVAQALKTAKKMLGKGVPLETIADLVEFDVNTVASWLGLDPA